jgi:hypothetical protein
MSETDMKDFAKSVVHKHDNCTFQDFFNGMSQKHTGASCTAVDTSFVDLLSLYLEAKFGSLDNTEDLKIKIHSLDLTKNQVIIIKSDRHWDYEEITSIKNMIKEVAGNTKIGVMLLRTGEEIEVILNKGGINDS